MTLGVFNDRRRKIVSLEIRFAKGLPLLLPPCNNACLPMTGRNSKDLKVLLVEDFEDTRLFMRLELEELGFIVFEAENGQVAVETAIREQPDVILMDLTLPLMDGFQATKLIRQNEGLKNVPVIAVTAHQEDDFRSVAKASGFDAYVTKPIDVNWLKELIAGLLT
jgi:two-component system, cell cycle response regulator DivK